VLALRLFAYGTARRAQKGKEVRHVELRTRGLPGFGAVLDARDPICRSAPLRECPAVQHYSRRLPPGKSVLGRKRNCLNVSPP